MAGRCFERPPKFRNRMILMLLGITLQGFGLSLLIRINLGTDPCSALTQGVNRFLPISFGTCQLLCHLINFLIVLRFDLSKIGFGTIGNMVCLGYITDFFGWIWDKIFKEGYFTNGYTEYIWLIPALVIFVIGASMYMCAGLGASPYDAVPFIISERTKKFSFKAIRMTWDIGYVIGALLLGGDVGIVTVTMAFFLGPVITWMQRKLAVFIE